MIARLWRGYSAPEKADGYRVILLRQTLPNINKRRGGYRGSFVLERTINGEIEFLISLWESIDAVRRVAGPKDERAVIHEEATAFLTRYDPESVHYAYHENK